MATNLTMPMNPTIRPALCRLTCQWPRLTLSRRFIPPCTPTQPQLRHPIHLHTRQHLTRQRPTRLRPTRLQPTRLPHTRLPLILHHHILPHHQILTILKVLILHLTEGNVAAPQIGCKRFPSGQIYKMKRGSLFLVSRYIYISKKSLDVDFFIRELQVVVCNFNAYCLNYVYIYLIS